MSTVRNVPFSELRCGEAQTMKHTVTRRDIELFAASSGDNNPVHLDEDYASKTRFGRTIMHGMFSGALISRMLGTQFPGPGTIYLSQHLDFCAPVYCGDELTLHMTVESIHPEKPVATLHCDIVNQDGITVTVGTSVVLVPRTEETTMLPPLPEVVISGD